MMMSYTKLTRRFMLSLLLIILALPMIAAYAQESEASQPETIGSRGGSVFVFLIGRVVYVTSQRRK
jgi:hypothetical protein